MVKELKRDRSFEEAYHRRIAPDELSWESQKALWHYEKKADEVLSLIDPTQLQEDHDLAYTISVLHTCLAEAFFEADETKNHSLKPEELDGLRAYYDKEPEKRLRGCVFNQVGARHKFSPEEEEKLKELARQFRANAQELVRAVEEGDDVKSRLLVRLTTSVSFLYSSLEQLLNSIPTSRATLKREGTPK